MQYTKDLDDVKSIVRYIEDDDEQLDDKIIRVIRLGRRQEGKCRPIRVQFVGQMYRDIAVRQSFRIRYHHANELLSKTIMSKDLCREDRERAKRKYIEKKQRREAEQERANRTVADDQNQTTPLNIDVDRPGASAGASASPQEEVQDNVP